MLDQIILIYNCLEKNLVQESNLIPGWHGFESSSSLFTTLEDNIDESLQSRLVSDQKK